MSSACTTILFPLATKNEVKAVTVIKDLVTKDFFYQLVKHIIEKIVHSRL